MKITEEKTLKLNLKGDEVGQFKSLLLKVEDREKAIGFNNSETNKEEKDLLTKIVEML